MDATTAAAATGHSKNLTNEDGSMPGGGLNDVLSGAQSIGRYFTIISALPSGLLVVFVYVLVKSESWVHSPDWSKGWAALIDPGISGVVWLTLASIGVALVTHPMQLAMVQFFEGYWGVYPITQALRVQRILQYQHECLQLEDDTADAETYWPLGDEGEEWSDSDEGEEARDEGSSQTTTEIRAHLGSVRNESLRIRDTYFPRAIDHIMPTRLGNVMRRFEVDSGSQYALDAPTVFPHLMLVTPAEHAAYVNDQRSQLDLTVRMSFMSLIACAAAVLFLWRHGYWLLIACGPYFVAYLSYRGAIVLARQYATAANTVVDLNRFALYKSLGLDRPRTTINERTTNKKLRLLLGEHSEYIVMNYEPSKQDD
ncbi:hypothetical protein [Microbispora bryophytorum]|uniref:hypothetical protein n=1 Tax=Microbispora bryophytorum TaxID=1460882 RepID=UPI0033D13C38